MYVLESIRLHSQLSSRPRFSRSSASSAGHCERMTACRLQARAVLSEVRRRKSAGASGAGQPPHAHSQQNGTGPAGMGGGAAHLRHRTHAPAYGRATSARAEVIGTAVLSRGICPPDSSGCCGVIGRCTQLSLGLLGIPLVHALRSVAKMLAHAPAPDVSPLASILSKC